MTVEIKQPHILKDIDLKVKEITEKINEDKRDLMKKYFGSIKLAEDPVVMQRQWRDEWK